MGLLAFPWLAIAILSLLILKTFSTYEGCQFPSSWSGHWFQMGEEGPIIINSTHIGTKGECVQNQKNKYITLDRSNNDKIYKCIVMHQKHPNVLQYHESYGSAVLKNLEDLCDNIVVDSMFSMFRSEGAEPIPCPFRSSPYSFSYSGGKGDCKNPPSRVDSCTDDSRLLFRYAACPDVSGSQSNVEEMVCLATWREASLKYLMAKMDHKLATSDEDRYRCFIYDKANEPGVGTVYHIAQSGDASCNGIQSSIDGSKMMNLTRLENQHDRCKFPNWIVIHHHWHSLDFAHTYHFLHKNATLRVLSEQGVIETRLVCHRIVKNSSSQVILVAHITTGCESGFVCMVFHHRDSHVIQVQHSNSRSQEASEACAPGFLDLYNLQSPVTLVTSSLPTLPCPNSGRYNVLWPQTKTQSVADPTIKQTVQCNEENEYTLLAVGCNSPSDAMEFHLSCPEEHILGYNCHGSWTENSSTYIVASPVNHKSTDAKYYCFIFNQKQSQTTLQRVAESCVSSSHQLSSHFNLSSFGKCTETSSSKDTSSYIFPSAFSLFITELIVLVLR